MIEISSTLRRLHPDIIHVRGLQNEGFHGIMAAYLSGCRNVLVSVHGFAADVKSRKPINRIPLSQFIEPMTLLLAKKVYCVHTAAKERRVISRYARNKSSVIHNGIEILPPVDRDNGIRKELGVKM